MPTASSPLADWLQFQQSIHTRSIDLELSRVSAVADRLGVKQPHCPVITVGGTNGKGSVVAHLDAFLRAAGKRTGVFTSPHLIRYNERIRVDGAEASDDELVAAFERIERARGEITLTYFEYSTLAALVIFAAREVDIVVLEVGLGGRLDATNIVDASVAVLCSIGFDHRDWLGDTLRDIGREKAGIFRAGRPAVLGSPQMPPSVSEAIEKLAAQAILAEHDFSWSVAAQGRWSFRGRRWRLDDLPPSALAGTIQYRNAATAIAALENILSSTAAEANEFVAAGLRSIELPGRFQIIPGPVEWILDVAHNEPAAHVLADALAARPCAGRTFAVVSILGDKEIEAIGHVLSRYVDHWILCTLREPRGLDARELAARLRLPLVACSLTESVVAGCERARSLAQPGDRVVACGSFLVVGSVLPWLGYNSRPAV